MLVQYTSIRDLSADELQRLLSFAKTLGESHQPYVIFEGKTIKTQEVKSLLPPTRSHQLNG